MSTDKLHFIDQASNKSIWRGVDVYEAHKVLSYKKVGEKFYEGVVLGSNGEKYNVRIDCDHPKRSKCDCAFSQGRYVVCKHMIALYFTVFPETKELLDKRVEQEEEEERLRNRPDDVRKYVNSLTKEELRNELYDALIRLDDIDNSYW